MANVCPICNNPLRQYGDNFYVCDVCETYFDKNENIVLTEQEWLQTADTEQLAEWLRGVYWHCHEIDCEHCNYPWRCMEKGDIVKWLKQPHLTSK